MIINSSAIVAVLKEEPEAAEFLLAFASGAQQKRISAANYLEAAIVVDANRNPLLSHRFDDLIQAAGLVVEAVTREQAEIARAAYRDFGKGSGHSASLNFGDCFAYALAKAMGEPPLFKGDVFSKTDIAAA